MLGPGTDSRVDLLGRTIAGKFCVLEHIGSGAMGDVYKARHLALDTAIALKILRKSDDPLFAQRFQREAKAASRLDHPNSIRVLDYGTDADGLTYIAMEYIPGRDLLQLLADEWPLSEERIIGIVMQALSAISVAHGLGIVHRDLKPENIMVLEAMDDEGRHVDTVKVCDFGIAKLSDPRAFQTGGHPALTSTGMLVGTPEYMSPEQARGDELDARSDVYSMGVIVYQLLTGRVPFTAQNALGVVLKQVTDTPRPPSEERPGLSPGLERVCLKALEKAKEDRFQSAREMRTGLRMILDEGPASSAPSRPLVSETADTVEVAPGPSRRDHSGPRLKDLERDSSTPPPRDAARSNRVVLVLAVLGTAAIVSALTLTVPKIFAPAIVGAVPTAPPEVELAPLAPPVVPPLGTGTSRSQAVQRPLALPEAGAPASPIASATASASSEPVPLASASASASAGIARSMDPLPVVPAPVASDPAPAPFSADRAHLTIGIINTTDVPETPVRSKMRTLQGELVACYRAALAKKGARVAGTVTLNLSFDDKGRIATCVATGLDKLSDAARCFERTVAGKQVSGLDGRAGTAEVWITLVPD